MTDSTKTRLWQRVTVSLPAGLREKAHSKGLNVSSVAANALIEALKKLESKDGV